MCFCIPVVKSVYICGECIVVYATPIELHSDRIWNVNSIVPTGVS